MREDGVDAACLILGGNTVGVGSPGMLDEDSLTAVTAGTEGECVVVRVYSHGDIAVDQVDHIHSVGVETVDVDVGHAVLDVKLRQGHTVFPFLVEGCVGGHDVGGDADFICNEHLPVIGLLEIQVIALDVDRIHTHGGIVDIEVHSYVERVVATVHVCEQLGSSIALLGALTAVLCPMTAVAIAIPLRVILAALGREGLDGKTVVCRILKVVELELVDVLADDDILRLILDVLEVGEVLLVGD